MVLTEAAGWAEADKACRPIKAARKISVKKRWNLWVMAGS
jgi:hypothetical protein